MTINEPLRSFNIPINERPPEMSALSIPKSVLGEINEGEVKIESERIEQERRNVLPSGITHDVFRKLKTTSHEISTKCLALAERQTVLRAKNDELKQMQANFLATLESISFDIAQWDKLEQEIKRLNEGQQVLQQDINKIISEAIEGVYHKRVLIDELMHRFADPKVFPDDFYEIFLGWIKSYYPIFNHYLDQGADIVDRKTNEIAFRTILNPKGIEVAYGHLKITRKTIGDINFAICPTYTVFLIN